MSQGGFFHRVLSPVLRLFVVMAVSYTVYKLSWRIEQPFLHNWLAHVFGILFFLCLGFGTFYVYRQTYFRGAGPGERILACFTNPLIWVAKEVMVLTGIYTIGESLYFILNPVNILLYSAVVAEIGLASLITRRKARKMGLDVPSSRLPAAAALILGLASVIFPFAWEMGVNHFYVFQEGFKALFGYGVGL
jgi:hypothetical protein